MRIQIFVMSAVLLGALSGCMAFNADGMDGKGAAQKSIQGIKVAQTLFEKGDFHSAAKIYHRLLLKEPENGSLWQRYAQALYTLHSYAEALDAYDSLVKLDAHSCTGLIGAGRSNLKLGRPKNAGIYFEHCIKIEPKNKQALSGRAISYDMSGKRGASASYYQKAINADPSDFALRNNFAMSLLLDGKFDAAIGELNKIAFGPHSRLLIRQNLALVYGLKGDIFAAEHVASLDLPPLAVANNLKYFALLRGIKDRENIRSILFPETGQ